MACKTIVSDFKLADKALFLLSLLLVISSYFYFWQTTPASHAIIQSPLNDALHVRLDNKQIHHIQGALGISTIEVSQGKIRFVDSPCQNKFCIQHGWQHRHRDIAACLPNRISVQLANLNDTSRYDAINF